MTRRNPPAKWVLPDVIDPPERVCYQIQVPDTLYHKAAFFGALLDLAAAYKWADDPAHTAKDVALVWRDIIDNLQVCTPTPASAAGGISLEDMLSQQIRISPDNPCIIQMWCIDHWEDWYDPQECIATGAGQQVARDGEEPGPGESATYCFTVNARVPYLFPVSVNTGDTITVGDVSGAWTDGQLGLLSTWDCPNGQAYTLGACSGPTFTDAGNPMPSEPTMGLIAFVDSQYFYVGNGTTFVIPSGVTDGQLLFLPNTADQTMANGSVSCCVTIQRLGPLPVTVSYLYGTGPNQVSNGGTFVFESQTVGAEEDLVFTFSSPVKVTVLTSTLSVVCGSYPCDYAYVYNPTATLIQTLAWPTTPLTSITDGTVVQKFSISSGSGGAPWNMTVTIEFV